VIFRGKCVIKILKKMHFAKEELPSNKINDITFDSTGLGLQSSQGDPGQRAVVF
jgi:hypothetical protein